MRLTDGGLETTLIFQQAVDLPGFAAFPLLETEAGRAQLRAYWAPFLELAGERGIPFSVDTVTWRANRDWGAGLGYDVAGLRAANLAAARFARHLAATLDDAVVTGVIGPRGDGYVVGDTMSPDQAASYHAPQVAALADGGVDQVALLTVTYPDEATGFLAAAAGAGVPALASFTVETDGLLPDGSTLRAAVERVDEESEGSSTGFMVNCAHPTHVEPALDDGPWLDRITGLRANASTMSHAELDAAEELDAGDPEDLARRYADLRDRLPNLALVGGCCGTDVRHVRAIADAVF
ncbi:MAG: Homocysteine methyltransferase [Nocardioidaceae bacterium]|nr:Homocysteine methyltransferase [Nocardioidaceae bacterium]